MRLLRRGRLLFRTYLVIVGGLIATAAVFDFAFSRLQGTPEAPPEAPWVAAALDLIEARLIATPRNAREDAASTLESELGFPVRFLSAEAVVHAGDDDTARTQELFDAEGRSLYLRSSAALGGAIQVGPILGGDDPPHPLVDLIPHLFYVAVLVIVALWLWPLIRDVDLLTRAAHVFAADYRHPLATRDKTSTLRDLATSFDAMAARIAGLIQGQKDLTSALSHEVRTPLARIKFAMAVIAEKQPIAAELESIEQDVREIDRLIGVMLDYARLDHPDAELNWQLTPADAWVHEAARRVLLREGQSIGERAPGPALRMDPDRMALAASNLLVNACRYA